MKKRFGKNDLVFLGILITIALIVLSVGNYAYRKNGARVTVIQDGEVYGTYSLHEEQTIPIKKDGKTTNILQITGGKAGMLTADCPDQLCVHQKEISKEGQNIVCLPNKVVVEIDGGEDTEFDSIAK